MSAAMPFATDFIVNENDGNRSGRGQQSKIPSWTENPRREILGRSKRGLLRGKVLSLPLVGSGGGHENSQGRGKRDGGRRRSRGHQRVQPKQKN